MDIKLKTRMPLMVQNMINDLKVKCPRYAQCKYRGTLRGLAEHEVSCKNNAKNISAHKHASIPAFKYFLTN